MYIDYHVGVFTGGCSFLLILNQEWLIVNDINAAKKKEEKKKKSRG